MTDVSGLLGNWRVVLTGFLAVLTAAVVTVFVRTGDPATAETRVIEAVNAAIALPDGRTLVAEPGVLVPPGAVVRTGTCGTEEEPRACGAAQLRTSDRDVYLGADSVLRVADGVRQTLDKGLTMVDSRRGPRLDLTTRTGVLAVADGALVRVELGPLFMRVGTFTGMASLAAAGRSVTKDVPTLHQIRAPYVGLPGLPTALSLTGDSWEERLATALVAADRDLVRLALGLSGPQGRTVLSLVPTALRTVVVTAAPAAVGEIGESALAVALAQAGQGGSVAERLTTVRQSLSDGGSWGVVAALVNARVSAVSKVLDQWLEPGETVPPVDALGGPGFDSVFGGTPRPAPAPSTVGPSRSGPTPTPTVSPTVSPTATPTTPADDVVTIVSGLLSPPPTPTPVGPSPTPFLDLGIIRIG